MQKKNYGNPHLTAGGSNPAFNTSPRGSFNLAKNFKLPPLNFKPAMPMDDQTASMTITDGDGTGSFDFRQISTQGKNKRSETEEILNGFVKPRNKAVSSS